MKAIEADAKTKGWDDSSLWSSEEVGDQPRGLAYIMRPYDSILEVTEDAIKILTPMGVARIARCNPVAQARGLRGARLDNQTHPVNQTQCDSDAYGSRNHAAETSRRQSPRRPRSPAHEKVDGARTDYRPRLLRETQDGYPPACRRRRLRPPWTFRGLFGLVDPKRVRGFAYAMYFFEKWLNRGGQLSALFSSGRTSPARSRSRSAAIAGRAKPRAGGTIEIRRGRPGLRRRKPVVATID